MAQPGPWIWSLIKKKFVSPWAPAKSNEDLKQESKNKLYSSIEVAVEAMVTQNQDYIFVGKPSRPTAQKSRVYWLIIIWTYYKLQEGNPRSLTIKPWSTLEGGVPDLGRGVGKEPPSDTPFEGNAIWLVLQRHAHPRHRHLKTTPASRSRATWSRWIPRTWYMVRRSPWWQARPRKHLCFHPTTSQPAQPTQI